MGRPEVPRSESPRSNLTPISWKQMDQNLSFLMPLGDILQSLFHMPASRFLAKCHWNAFVMFDTCMFFLSFIFRCFVVWAMKSNFRFNVLMLTLRLNVKDMCQVGIKCCLVILSKVRIEVSIRFKMEIVPFVINNWFQKQRKQNKTKHLSVPHVSWRTPVGPSPGHPQ